MAWQETNVISSAVRVASLTRATSSLNVLSPRSPCTTPSVKSVPYVQLSMALVSALCFLCLVRLFVWLCSCAKRCCCVLLLTFVSTILGTTVRMFSCTYQSPTVGSLHVAKKKSLVTCPTVRSNTVEFCCAVPGGDGDGNCCAADTFARSCRSLRPAPSFAAPPCSRSQPSRASCLFVRSVRPLFFFFLNLFLGLVRCMRAMKVDVAMVKCGAAEYKHSKQEAAAAR